MIEAIRDILLEHKGREKAITSKQISAKLNFPMEDTQSFSRAKIKKAEETYGLPLISCNKGYFIAQTEEEMADYEQNITNRIEKMRQRKEMARNNYERWKNEVHTEE